jgi:hypothetical protein
MKLGKFGGISLARQYAILLAIVFIVFELLMAAVVLHFLMLPMARRAAGDLAGLMVLSAQTWSELPPESSACAARGAARRRCRSVPRPLSLFPRGSASREDR